jgi:hypothetical protein
MKDKRGTFMAGFGLGYMVCALIVMVAQRA